MSNPAPYISAEPSIDVSIGDLLAQKDKRAVELIFEHYGALLLNVILKTLRDQHMAEDVLQQVLLKVWQKSDQFNPHKGSLFSWLVKVSRNAAIDKTRTKDFRLTEESKRGVELVNITEKANEDNVVDTIYMEQLIDRLPEIQKKLISMSFFEGYTHKEISQRLDMPLGTVKSRIRLAIQHLRAIV